MNKDLGIEIHLNVPYLDAVERVTTALRAEGFGILTRIDVTATMKEKLGVDYHPYIILGACNPPLAHKALTLDPALGLMLPCNVTVEAEGQTGSLVRIINPEKMVEVSEKRDEPEMVATANEARLRLERVAHEVSKQ